MKENSTFSYVKRNNNNEKVWTVLSNVGQMQKWQLIRSGPNVI